MPAAVAELEIERLERLFKILPEISEVYPAWKRLVTQHQVIGKPAHDARLVAAMHVHGVASILTFDKSGFSRYDGINVVHPSDIIAAP